MPITYDGDFDNAAQHGPWRPMRDNDVQATLWERTMVQRSSRYTATPWDTFHRPYDPVPAGAFVIGLHYEIAGIGSTDFTAIGAASNTPGHVFQATGAGSGTGNALEVIFLVEESGHSAIGGDLLEWQQLYAPVPLQRIEAVAYAHEQQRVDTDGPSDILVRRVKPVTAFDQFDYFRTNDSRTITLFEAGSHTTARGAIFGLPRVTFATSYILAEDSELRRWRGNIWERKTKYVSPVETTSLPAL